MRQMDALAASRHRFTGRLAARFFVRFHMGLLFAGTVGAAVVASRLLLAAGVHSLMIRYALTVVGAYAVFFVLVRAWIADVNRIAPRDPGLDLPDVAPGGGGGLGGGGEFQPGGGQFGGGGASGGYDDVGEVPAFRSVAEAGGRGGGSTGSSGSSGGGGDWLSLDMDEGVVLVVALVLLVSVVGGTAVWLVWQAPVILPEAAFEALLAAGLVKAARRSEARGWSGVLKSTLIPFALVLAAASFAGWAAQRACPPAVRLTDVVRLCRGDGQHPEPARAASDRR
jgi:hypothetical protein